MALRTNSKQAVANLTAYIVSCIDSDNNDFAAARKIILNEFSNWLCPYEIHVNKTLEKCFEYWASGLPCDSLFLYYYNVSAKELAGKILEETNEEQDKYSEQQAERLLTKLIFQLLWKTATKEERQQMYSAIY